MNNFNEFIDYCLSFYGVGGIYPENKRTKEQIAYATTMYLDACAIMNSNLNRGMIAIRFLSGVAVIV